MKVLLLAGVLLMATALKAEEISVKVSGMVCAMCAQGIQKKFNKLPAVQTIKVDLGAKLVTVTTKDKQTLSDAQVKGIITEAGYNVASIERK